MNETELKYAFGGFVITVVAILQGAAWYIGFDGAVFAFTSLIIGGVVGSIFGFSLKSTKEIPPIISPKKKN